MRLHRGGVHARRPLAARDAARRAPAALERPARGHVASSGPRPIRAALLRASSPPTCPRTGSGSSCGPGLTGFAQVRRGYETSMAEKLAHDLEWIADRSVRLYLRTLCGDGGPRRSAVAAGGRERRAADCAPTPAAARRVPISDRFVPDTSTPGHGRDSPCRGSACRPAAGGMSEPAIDSACAGSAESSAREPRDRDRLARCRDAAHRGPDSEGMFVDGPVGLAARRLSIIDLETGDQPLANEDGTVARRPERRDLQLPRAARELEQRGSPLPHALRHRGDRPPLRANGASAFAERLRGMFALAIWDARAAAARARARPLRDQAALLPRRDGELSFASELRALPRGELDLDALEAFLAFNSIPAPLTIFREIAQAAARPPARLGGRRAARSSGTRGPAPAAAADVRDADEAELAEELRDAAARLGSRAPRRRRAGRRAALRRRRLGALAALAAQESSEAAAHVLDRLRGALVRRARRRARASPSATARDHRELVLRPGRARCSCPRSPRRSTSRSRTRRRCRRTSSRSSPPRT